MRGSHTVPDEPMEMLSPIIMTFGPVVDMLLGPWHPTTLEKRMMESILLRYCLMDSLIDQYLFNNDGQIN